MYHKKSESAKVHLHKCAAFRRCMNVMEIAERPDWYNGNIRGKKDTTSTALASLLKAVFASRESSIKSFALAKLTSREKLVFQKHMAMRYFVTCTSFQRIGDTHLKAAIQSLRPNDNLLPNRMQLAYTLLDECHQAIVKKVDVRVNGATWCLTTDAWSNVRYDPVVNYMAASPACSLFLESVSTGQTPRCQVHR
jgi:hypothetical protein